MMKKLLLISWTILLVGTLILGGFPFSTSTFPVAPAAAKKIVLKAASYTQTGAISTYALDWLIEKVNERSKGELIIDWIGAQNVIPGMEQPEAVRSGVIDVLHIPTAIYRARLPEAFPRHLWDYNAMDDRKSGFYDWMVELHKKKMNSYYLGAVQRHPGNIVGLNVKIQKPQELAGLKLIAVGYSVPAAKALSATAVNIPTPDRYGALERGVVDGVFNPINSFLDYAWFEVLKYFIDYTFWDAGNQVVLVNLNSWNKLPKHLQDLMNEVSIEAEISADEYMQKQKIELRRKLIDAGVNPIKFSPEDEKWFRSKLVDSGWAAVKKMVSPEDYEKLRKFGVK